jgi:hypothetical protein
MKVEIERIAAAEGDVFHLDRGRFVSIPTRTVLAAGSLTPRSRE